MSVNLVMMFKSHALDYIHPKIIRTVLVIIDLMICLNEKERLILFLNFKNTYNLKFNIKLKELMNDAELRISMALVIFLKYYKTRATLIQCYMHL